MYLIVGTYACGDAVIIDKDIKTLVEASGKLDLLKARCNFVDTQIYRQVLPKKSLSELFIGAMHGR